MSQNDYSVLLVDPDISFLEMVKSRLSSLKIKVDCASSLNDSRPFFAAKYNVVVAKYHLSGGLTGGDIIRMYKVKYPHTHSIIYSEEEKITEDTNGLEIDKLLRCVNIDDLIESIKIFCINEIEPQIIDAVFSEINKIKSKLISLQDSITGMGNLIEKLSTLDNKVNNFITNHKHDAYKIIAAFAALEALRAIWEKFFK